MAEHSDVIGVVGSGTMGAGIALVGLQSGHRVVLYDVQQAALDRADRELTQRIERLVHKGVLSSEEAADCRKRLTLSTELQAMKHAFVVIEAAPERIELKQTIFKALDDICSESAILASNTSSLSISVIAAATKHPKRVIGMHFFNPAPVMKLVEVVVGEDTSLETRDVIEALARNMGKAPIVCKDTPGFIVNRVARNFYGESLRIVGEGTASMQTVDALMQDGAGFRMGPFALMDLIGIDINFDVTQSVYHAYHEEPRYRPHILQAQKVAMNQLGKKSGRGYYAYGDEAVNLDSGATNMEIDDKMEVQSRKIAVVGDTPLATHLRRRIAEQFDLPEEDSGFVCHGPIASWDSLGIRWRCEEIEAWLRKHAPEIVLLSFAGETGYHRQLLQAVERGVGSQTWLVTSIAGPSATEQASWLVHSDRVLGFGITLPLANGNGEKKQGMEWTLSMQSEARVEGARLMIRDLANQCGLHPIQVRDGAGGVMMRVLSMIFNEASEVVREGVATPLDVDTGMQLGTNYPAGPTQWMDQIGLPTVWYTLDALCSEFGDDRYRPSPRLRHMLSAGHHGEQSGHGWYNYTTRPAL